MGEKFQRFKVMTGRRLKSGQSDRIETKTSEFGFPTLNGER